MCLLSHGKFNLIDILSIKAAIGGCILPGDVIGSRAGHETPRNNEFHQLENAK